MHPCVHIWSQFTLINLQSGILFAFRNVLVFSLCLLGGTRHVYILNKVQSHLASVFGLKMESNTTCKIESFVTRQCLKATVMYNTE